MTRRRMRNNPSREQLYSFMEKARHLIEPYTTVSGETASFSNRDPGYPQQVVYSPEADGASVTVVIGYDPGMKYHFSNPLVGLFYFYKVAVGILAEDYAPIGELGGIPDVRKEFLGRPGVGY